MVTLKQHMRRNHLRCDMHPCESGKSVSDVGEDRVKMSWLLESNLDRVVLWW